MLGSVALSLLTCFVGITTVGANFSSASCQFKCECEFSLKLESSFIINTNKFVNVTFIESYQNELHYKGTNNIFIHSNLY